MDDNFDLEDFWARKERAIQFDRARLRQQEKEYERAKRQGKKVLDKDYCEQSCGSPWCYFIGTILIFGLFLWFLHSIMTKRRALHAVAPSRPMTVTATSNGARPPPPRPPFPPRPTSTSGPGAKPFSMPPQQVLARILEVLRSRLEGTKNLTPEQIYILAPENVNKWKLTSTQPLMFVFSPESSMNSPVKRTWELFYDYKTQNVSLSPVEEGTSFGTSPGRPTPPAASHPTRGERGEMLSGVSNPNHIPTHPSSPSPSSPPPAHNNNNNGGEFTIQPYPYPIVSSPDSLQNLPVSNHTNIPNASPTSCSSNSRPPFNVSDYASFDPRSKSSSPVTYPYHVDQSQSTGNNGSCYSNSFLVTPDHYRVFNR